MLEKQVTQFLKKIFYIQKCLRNFSGIINKYISNNGRKLVFGKWSKTK